MLKEKVVVSRSHPALWVLSKEISENLGNQQPKENKWVDAGKC